MGILAVGSVAFDSIRTLFGKQDEILGGSASYFSVAASYFTDVHMLSVVGEDFPEAHADFFSKKGIDISGLQRCKGKTFRWKAEYGADWNSRTTLDTQFNVYADFSPQLFAARYAEDYLFLGSIDPDLQRAVLEKMPRPKLAACDTIDHWIDDRRDSLLQLLPMTDLLIINDSETRKLAGEQNLLSAAKKVLSLGLKRLVVKRGEYGAMMLDSKSIFCLPAFPVEEVIDPTGAGDAFAGGLMGYLAACGDCGEAALRKAMAFGTVMASFNVMDFGMRRLGDLTFTEIDARYKEFCKITYFGNSLECGSSAAALRIQ